MEKYVIYRTDLGKFCRWNEKVIMFANIEEVDTFKKEFPGFFALVDEKHVHVTQSLPGINFRDVITIDYKDLSEKEKKDNPYYNKL